MTKQLTVILSLVLITSFSIAQSVPAPSPAAHASFTSVSGRINNNNRFILNWVVDNNQIADQFEIEKSVDGKNFTQAGLVFGTDRVDYNDYQFFEKAGRVKTFYRIKLIGKDKTAHYSSLIEANPGS